MTVISPLYLFLIMLTLIIVSIQYKKINKSLFITPVVMIQLTFIISFYTVIFLYQAGNIDFNIFRILMIQFLMLFVVVLVSPHFIRDKNLNIKSYLNIRGLDIQVTTWIFYLNLIVNTAYIIILWGSYSDGSDRLVLNRNFRTLSLLSLLFFNWSIILSSVVYIQTKNKRFMYYVIITILLSFFLGSKSMAVTAVFTYLFFYFQFNSIKLKKQIAVFLLILIVIIIPTQFMYGDAINTIMFRIAMSGDIYLYSFVIGDYTKLIGLYDPLMYILHPFSSLMGIRGYDFPMGAQILSTANLNVTGVGPQDHITMLGLLFFDRCFSCIVIFTLFFALLMLLSFVFAFFIIRQTKIHLFFRLYVFTSLYFGYLGIFIGIGFYSFSVILIILSFIIYLVVRMLQSISKKNSRL